MCSCNGNPALRELSMKLALNYWIRAATEHRRHPVQIPGALPPWAEQVICRRTGRCSCHVIRRLAEQTGTRDGAIELRTVELLTQRLTWMETKEPHTFVQRTEVYSFSSANVTDETWHHSCATCARPTRCLKLSRGTVVAQIRVQTAVC